MISLIIRLASFSETASLPYKKVKNELSYVDGFVRKVNVQQTISGETPGNISFVQR